MLRNREFVGIIVKLLILQLIFAVVGYFMVDMFMDKLNRKIVDRDLALFGSLIGDNPELRENIVPYITKGIDEKHRELGEKTLKEYGYHIEMNKEYQPILKGSTLNMQIVLFFSILLYVVPLGFVIILEYKKLYGKVQKVSSAAEKVVEGDFSIYLDEEGEGDFNILNHQFNQMVNRLENSLTILKKDKIFLKNMISDISHQLKTPLSSMIVLNDILIEDTHMDREVQMDFLVRTRGQLERMEWLIINLLKVARIEAEAIEFKREYVLLKDVLDIALKTLSTQLEGKTISVQGNLQTYFYGDIDWTAEALINIIKNSTEHGGDDIDIILEDTPLFSRISIRDNGEGIAKEHMPHIFERFYKINSEVKPESIGIGLNLTKLIVESQGGTIHVNSDKGKGTEFIITFLKDKGNLTKL